MSVIEQMNEVREQRKKAAENRADELARQDAAGKKVSAVEALDTITAAGLPDDWFAKRVVHYRTRAALLAKTAAQAELEKRRQQCQKILDEANAELKDAAERCAAKADPAAQEDRALGAQIGEAIQARAELLRTCKDPAILGRLNEIGQEIGQGQGSAKTLTARQKYLTGEIERLQPQLDYQVSKKSAPTFGRDPRVSSMPSDYDAREHEQLEKAISGMQAELPKVQAAIEAIPGTVAGLERERADLLTRAEASPL